MDSSNLLTQIKESFRCKEQDIRTYSPLALAYMGDAVYDLIIRTVIVERANRAANDLHRMAISYVKAPSQARIIECLLPLLTQEEEAVYKRGRNANPHTVAKNASRSDYRKATGFEALIGYLYLAGNQERILYLVKEGISLAEMTI